LVKENLHNSIIDKKKNMDGEKERSRVRCKERRGREKGRKKG